MTALVSLFNSGDHVVCGDDIYGGTNRLLRQVFSRLGIEVSYVDTRDVENIAKAIKPNTKVSIKNFIKYTSSRKKFEVKFIKFLTLLIHNQCDDLKKLFSS